GNLEETVTKNNLEAAEEVVRQLRLRDIGGIIVIDFIDMVLESNRDLVLRRLVECLGRDRTKHQVAEVTSLGLVQMTRKRMGTGLLEVFGEQCEHCAGRGVITHDEPVEHRRAGAATEHHQVRIEKRSERQSRSEKRRSRGQGQQESPVEAPAAVAQEDDAERKAKAEAARAALANIAAAAHAAHEAEEHPEAAKAKQHDGGAAPAASGTGKPEAAAATAPAQQQPAASGRKRRSRRADDSGIAAAVAAPAATAGEDGGAGVLKINGETVAIPRATHAPAAAPAEPSLTLESLTEAFNKVAPVEKPERTAPEPAAAAQPAARSTAAEPSAAADQSQSVAAEPQAPAAGPVRKPRRRRAASS